MNTLSARTKLTISLAVALFILFLFGETTRFHLLWASDDNGTGTGLLPIICCAVPSAVLLLLSFVSYKADRRRLE